MDVGQKFVKSFPYRVNHFQGCPRINIYRKFVELKLFMLLTYFLALVIKVIAYEERADCHTELLVRPFHTLGPRAYEDDDDERN